MDEEAREVEDTGREPKCHDKKHNCIINIFCHDKKHDDKWDGDMEHDGHCIINIFCNKKHDDKCDEHDGGW